MEVIVLFS